MLSKEGHSECPVQNRASECPFVYLNDPGHFGVSVQLKQNTDYTVTYWVNDRQIKANKNNS